MLQLAISAFLFLQSIPLNVSEIQHQDWIHGTTVCKLSESLKYINYYASILFITAVAVDRYLAVCRCQWKATSTLRSSKFGYINAAVIWIVSIMMTVPVTLYAESVQYYSRCHCVFSFPAKVVQAGCRSCHPNCVEEEDYESSAEYYSGSDYYDPDSNNDTSTSCFGNGDKDPGMTAFVIFNFVIMFLVPLIVIATSYACIVWRLRRTTLRSRRSFDRPSENWFSGTESTKRASRIKPERPSTAECQSKVTALCAALITSFVICWLPYHSIHLAKIDGLMGTEKFCHNLQSAVRFLIYLNSATNPFMYNFLGTFSQRIREFQRHRRTEAILQILGRAKAGTLSPVTASEAVKVKRSNVSSGSDANCRKDEIPLKDSKNGHSWGSSN